MDKVIPMFAMVGLLAITGGVLYYVAKYLQKYTPVTSKDWQSSEYMEKIGAVCPNGWRYENIGTPELPNWVCKKPNNVPSTASCHDISFERIPKWDDCIKNPSGCDGLRQRCNWLNGREDPVKPQYSYKDKPCKVPWINIENRC